MIVLLLGSGVVTPSLVHARSEAEIRKDVKIAEQLEAKGQWELARQLYESLLKYNDPGLNIRERYQHVVRRSWQVRRHQDMSYRKEVLSVDYGQSLRLLGIINNTLLDGAFNKKKIDSAKLFRKGIEEFDAALADREFLKQYVPTTKHEGDLAAFRTFLQKTAKEIGGMSRNEAVKRIGEIALAAEVHLDIDPTVVVMEFACGGCYAIDEYTVYLTPNELRELAQSLSQNEVTSVGVLLRIHDNRIVVRDVLLGSPAAGSEKIFKDDELISIDKQPVANLNLAMVKNLLDGPLGSMVELEIRAPGDDLTTIIRLTRQATVASVIAGPQEGTPYWYMKITSFADNTPQNVDKALQELTRSGAKGLILDLRQNSGGIVDSSIETARKFLSKGIITSSVNQDTKQSQVYHARNANALAIPMMLLVDNDTASAAEILAGALKDNDRAMLIGHTTFGKGCTQTVLKLPPASGGVPTGGMRLTVARFFSPKGVAYSGRGVIPHIFIDENMAASQATAMSNPYVDRAIEELNRVLSMPK